MISILKYQLEIISEQVIILPAIYKFLSAQFQKDILCIWLLANIEVKKFPVIFNIVGTGCEINRELYEFTRNNFYRGTVQNNEFVWHLFEKQITPDDMSKERLDAFCEKYGCAPKPISFHI